MKISNLFKHFKTVCKHKYWVFYYCRKMGITWRGIKHDMSKFSPIEFFESVKYYQGTSSPINACKADKGYSKAWQHHKGRNTHHYEYWQDKFDDGTVHLVMPFKDTLEMFCDYLGAGRAYMGKNFSYQKEYEWWKINRDSKKAMNEVQCKFLNYAFDVTAKEHQLPKKEELKMIYNFYFYIERHYNKRMTNNE